MDTFQNYGTNIAATVTAALIFGIAWCVKNKCKHSKCAINSKCINCSADDADTIREPPIRKRRPSITLERVVSREEGQI